MTSFGLMKKHDNKIEARNNFCLCLYIYICIFSHVTFNLISLNIGEIEVHHMSQNIIETTYNHSFWSHYDQISNATGAIPLQQSIDEQLCLPTTVSINNCSVSCQTHTNIFRQFAVWKNNMFLIWSCHIHYPLIHWLKMFIFHRTWISRH